jgi:hypothetical protein
MEPIDALERRDRWRTLWSALTHDLVFGVLAATCAIAMLAHAVLPQAPTAGSTRSTDQWFAEQALQLGSAYDPLQATELLSITTSRWVRIVLVLFAAIALARLADRIARIVRDRGGILNIEDEVRLRVTDAAPTFDALGRALSARRYRVREHADTLHATRAPLAAALSALGHAGALLAAGGLLLNIMAGWDAANELLQPGAPLTVRDGFTLALDENQSNIAAANIALNGETLRLMPDAAADSGATRVELRTLAPGYRVSAASTDRKPLSIVTSIYLSPTNEVRLSFGAERTIDLAVPEAQAALTIQQGASQGADRVQILSIGSAQLITDAAIAPSLAITDAVFSFAPNINALVNVRHRPGNTLAALGMPLALLFLILAALLPMRRMIIRHHGHWTEVYASGRGVRADVRAMLGARGAPTADGGRQTAADDRRPTTDDH